MRGISEYLVYYLCLFAARFNVYTRSHRRDTVFAVAATVPFGIQSGLDTNDNIEDNGSSYAAAMSYDTDNNALFITGSTYGTFWNVDANGEAQQTNKSSCFFSILSLASETTTQVGDLSNPTWAFAERLGFSYSVESCSAILRVDSNKVYLGGQSEEAGLLTNLRNPGSEKSVQYGFVADIDVDFRSDGASTAQLLGGRLFHSNPVQTAKALTSVPLGDALFIVSEESDVGDTNPDFSGNEPNLIEMNKFGRNYFLKIQKMLVKPISSESSGTTIQSPTWTKEIATSLNSVDVAGISFLSSSTLLLAGSAIGSGGKAIPVSETTDTWAGFVALLDANDGHTINALRIDRDTGRTVRVESTCKQPDQETVIYLVGSTNGSYEIEGYGEDSMTAFLIRLRVPELTIEWSKQVAATVGPLSSGKAELLGSRCSVTDDGKHVYVGGVAKDGSIVNSGSGHQSEGGDDLWIAQLDAQSKSWTWTHQLGTSRDESLSDMTVDVDGNVILLGNTEGSFMRQKSSAFNDVFVIGMTRETGDYPVPVESGQDAGATGSNPTPSPTTKKGPTQAIPSLPTHQPIIARRPTLPPVGLVDASAGDKPIGSGGNAGAIAVAVVLSSVGLIVACFVWQRRSQFVRESDGSQVLDYLKGFDDVEVDLKHSATGGWHGTYVNHDGGPRFYNGSGMPEETVTFGGSGNEMSPLTHSAIVEDSLFSMYDDDDGPGEFGGVLERRKSSYKGLVDVYNNTWSDRSLHQLPGHQSLTPRPLVDINIDEEEVVASWGREII